MARGIRHQLEVRILKIKVPALLNMQANKTKAGAIGRAKVLSDQHGPNLGQNSVGDMRFNE